ncbi:hypothetical protein [Streptomyces uncialis]|uniref:hypothetical protein n=1 Tax=Streptomyces uncialis TaxID=1048205 RepID=UPI0033F32DAC
MTGTAGQRPVRHEPRVRHEPVVRVLRGARDQASGTVTAPVTRVPEPPWWREAPAAVAEVLAALPGLTPRTPLHFAVAEYCAVAGELYTRRVAGMKHRLRPSASTELEPSRLLTPRMKGSAAHYEAYFHCGPGDAEAAEQAARAALVACPADGAAVLRIRCTESLFELRGELVTVSG